MSDFSSIRLMSWNILEGFHIRAPGRTPLWDHARLAAAQDLIARENPNILVLNEALWCRPVNGYQIDYAKLLGFPYSVNDTYDDEWGNTILSKVVPEVQRRFRIHNRGGLRATYMFGEIPLEVATYHPHPDRRHEMKAKDFEALLAPVDQSVSFVVAGDFNAIAPSDAPDLDQMEGSFAEFSANPRAEADRFIQSGRSIFPILEAWGMRDGIPAEDRGYTIPTDVLSMDKSSGMRIDHVWVNDLVRVRSARIVRDHLSDAASDHYPVVVDLDIFNSSNRNDSILDLSRGQDVLMSH